jgi:hypothetical protein
MSSSRHGHEHQQRRQFGNIGREVATNQNASHISLIDEASHIQDKGVGSSLLIRQR